VSHARKIVRQMLDTLESAALYIIFIPHTLVCSGSACGKSDVRRSMAFVERLASVPFPISAPSVMAAGISVTGSDQGILAPFAGRRGALEPHPLADQA
jgi:hypothetical protein